MKPNIQQVIKHNCVRVDGDETATGSKGRSSRGSHAKQVELLRVQGHVRAIQLRCACGETTVVELGYADDKKGSA
jgi:hypothetical protein